MDSIILPDFFENTIANNTVRDYAVALIIFSSILIVTYLIKFIVSSWLKSIAKKTTFKFDDLIVNVVNTLNFPIITILALNLSVRSLEVSELLTKSLYYLSLIAGTYLVARIVIKIINYGAESLQQKMESNNHSGEKGIINIIKTVLSIAVWIFAGILILENLGYDVSALVAGVGISGIAIAFALQNVLEDIFASISIYFDKPFKEGDFIIVGSDLGTVKKVGLKSSRLKTLQGEELVISNKELTQARIRNYKRMESRRVEFSLGVTYETPTEKVKKIPELIGNIFKNIENTKLDRVHFKSFGDFALNIEIVYILKDKDYNVYMDVQQTINLGIKESFEKEGIEFAYPTQTILLQK